jgi:hypothetical protein
LAFSDFVPLWRNLIFMGVVLLWLEAWLELNLELQCVKLQLYRYGLMLGIKSVIALALGAALAIYGLGPYGPLFGLIGDVSLPRCSWDGASGIKLHSPLIEIF